MTALKDILPILIALAAISIPFWALLFRKRSAANENDYGLLAFCILSVCVLVGAVLWLTRHNGNTFTSIAPPPPGQAASDPHLQPIQPLPERPPSDVRVGFAETDITPDVKARPVYMAGFSQNRKATGVHDPLKARAVVLKDGDKKLAIASIDVIGFFHPNVENVRSQLGGFTYVIVSSTHNHEGPDTLGLWGPNPFSSGVDENYLKRVQAQIVAAVKAADAAARPVRAFIGTATAPELLRDSREPYVKHDELVALRFVDDKEDSAGVIVQWNCHPETLNSKNTEISADFVGYTVDYLKKKYNCPVVYLTGTVGGLMTSLGVEIENEKGELLADGTFAKTEEYGQRIGKLAEKALAEAKPVKLTPLDVRSRVVFVPMTNNLYQLGRQLGVLNRPAYLWSGDPTTAEPAPPNEFKKPMCIRTEVARLWLGQLRVACVPGEIYPELVLGAIQNPADAGADFPEAPMEPPIYAHLRGEYRMLIGLANDEIGYIIPKRQWDEKPPFCYGRKKAQYGERNSVGPDTAPILCDTLRQLAEGK
jgi:hypothetical protein